MEELAARTYVPKLYRINATRRPVVELLEYAVEASGGRVVNNSFRDRSVAPLFLAAEDGNGHRYGMLIYPFTATFRSIKRRPDSEHRFQVRFGDPVVHRSEPNPLGRDPAGVDVTLVLAVDPELGLIVGLDPFVYGDLPIGVSGYYRDEDARTAASSGWHPWVKEKRSPRGRSALEWDGLEAMVGIRPERFLDFVRFEAAATSLGLDTALRSTLADTWGAEGADRHSLERLFGIDAGTILDIVESNFRLGVAVRGSVAEHHLHRLLLEDPGVRAVTPIDADGRPDFEVVLSSGRQLTIECKNALRETYKTGDAKVEVQKTRDSASGRKYPFSAFDVVAACMFSVTGRWEFRFKLASDLHAWTKDTSRIAPIQRIDDSWSESLAGLNC